MNDTEGIIHRSTAAWKLLPRPFLNEQLNKNLAHFISTVTQKKMFSVHKRAIAKGKSSQKYSYWKLLGRDHFGIFHNLFFEMVVSRRNQSYDTALYQ